MSCSVEVDIPLDNDDTNQEPYVIPNDIQVPTLGLLRYPINIFGTDIVADSLKISFENINGMISKVS